MSDLPIILGSRSPQRFALLSQLVACERIQVCPPEDADEAGFEGLVKRRDILDRVAQIAAFKAEQVCAQQNSPQAAILCADTVILATDAEADVTTVLGQPPMPDWQETVRDWFRRYYSGRTHEAVTAVVIYSPHGLREFQVVTEVTFSEVTEEQLDWYIATGEPVGKAGGYALQGAGGLFVDSLRGCPSNVIGLPLRATWSALSQLGLL